MAKRRISMHKLREMLRLRWQQELSVRQISDSIGVSTGFISQAIRRATAVNLTWEVIETLTDSQLEARVYGQKSYRKSHRVEPEYDKIHLELRQKGVTLELLHIEYLARHPEGYKYSRFCAKYREWLNKQKIAMRQIHKAGEKLFVDYSGKKPKIVDKKTGEATEVELFVAVLGASNYTYIEATKSQQIPDWLQCHVHAFEFFGGVPEVVVPDQLRSAVEKPSRDIPILQQNYAELGRHYSTAIVPARPYSPKDKAKVEVGVQIVQRWILARIRHETFFSLASLNERLHELLDELNERPMKSFGGQSRKQLFNQLDKPNLNALPLDRFEYAVWKALKVNIDYHIQFANNYYSVPFSLVGQSVDIRATNGTVEIFYDRKRVASHPRSWQTKQHITNYEHAPADHKAWMKSDPGYLLGWAKEVGPSTEALMNKILKRHSRRELTWRAGRALKRVGERYGAARTEVACHRALQFGATSYKPVERMLKLGRENHPLLADTNKDTLSVKHEQIRGPDYYNEEN